MKIRVLTGNVQNTPPLPPERTAPERTRRASLALHSIYYEKAPERTVPLTNGAKMIITFKSHLNRYFYIKIRHSHNS